MSKTLPYNPIICAIDSSDIAAAKELVTSVAPHIGMIKLGLEFFCKHGPKGIADITNNGNIPFFLDLKFHDIPNTVAAAVTSVLPLKPSMITIHASGSAAMIEAARAAIDTHTPSGATPPLLLGVTILTSMDEAALNEIGLTDSPTNAVKRLATLAHGAGCDGVVCSGHELEAIRSNFPSELITVVPGIRPESAEKGDQSRVMTPNQALEAGANYLVIGRPITQAANPEDAAKKILQAL